MLKLDIGPDEPTQRGEHHNRAKLTEAAVRSMREWHAWKVAEVNRLNRKFSVRSMARRYGVAVGTAHQAIYGRTWRGVK